MARPHVAVVGDNTVDRFLDTGIDLVGGDALNTAVHLSMLGADACYFGAVGTDQPGELVLSQARLRGVDMRGAIQVPGPTALTTIRVLANGDRRFESEDFGVTADYTPDQEALARIASTDWVHLGMLGHADPVRAELVRINPRLRISQDCSVAQGFDHLAVAFLSADMIQDDPPAAATRALNAGARLVVVTLGARGVFATDGTSQWQFPATPLVVSDATGAGDAFMAGFIAATLAGGNIVEALAEGQQRGAYACGFLGGWPQTAADIASHG